jgi:hypothetical protein
LGALEAIFEKIIAREIDIKNGKQAEDLKIDIAIKEEKKQEEEATQT